MIKLKKLCRSSMSGRTNKGFSLVELLVAVAIMVVLVGVMVPTLISHIHKARVAVDWANLRSYYDEIQADFILTGEYNPKVTMVDSNIEGTYELREFEFLDGKKVKMKDGYFAVTKSTTGNGYQICYYCNQCLSGWGKHSTTCILTLGT